MWPDLERKMQECVEYSDDDPEAAHAAVDELLLDALHMASGNASTEFRRLYESVAKWYA